MLAFTRASLRALAIATSALAFTPSAAHAGRYHVYSCRMPDEQLVPADGWAATTTSTSPAVVAKNACEGNGVLISALSDGAERPVGTSSTWEFEALPGESIVEATFWRTGEADGGSVANAYYEFWIAAPEDIDRPPYVFDECVASFSCPLGGVGDTSQVRSSKNVVVVPQEDLGNRIYINASCAGRSGFSCPEGKKDPGGYSAAVYVYAADLVLEQNTQPNLTPGSVGGELATASKVGGTASLTFEAADSGSGVYQTIVEVDEKPVGSTVLDSNGGRCADVGQTSDGLPAFLYLKPCSPAVSADVPLDTTALSNGVHRVVVKVTNAAGDSTVVIDRQLEVANASGSGTSSSGSSGSSGSSNSSGSSTGSSSGSSSSGSSSSGSSSSGSSSSGSSSTSTSQLLGGTSLSGAGALSSAGGALGGGPSGPGAANGSPAASDAILSAHWRASAHATLLSRWGRGQTIVGKLTTAGGVPIAGASLEVRATPSAQGARASAISAPRTAADGSFSVRLSSHASSEQIVVAYRAHVGDPLPVALGTLTLRVPASLSLRVAPRTSHVGGTIAFSGTLHGGPLPPSGKQLVLQARWPGSGWRTFQALSTDRRGRYRASYRFRLPGPIAYSFRAVSRQESDFPFATGSSNVVRVFER